MNSFYSQGPQYGRLDDVINFRQISFRLPFF